MNETLQVQLTTGRLDRVLSEMVLLSKNLHLDESDWQTLKHHAEDMQAAGESILERYIKRETDVSCAERRD